MESQGTKYLLHKESWKVREKFCIKIQGKSGKKIAVENEFSKKNIWFSKLFSIKRVIGCVFFNDCLSCLL